MSNMKAELDESDETRTSERTSEKSRREIDGDAWARSLKAIDAPKEFEQPRPGRTQVREGAQKDVPEIDVASSDVTDRFADARLKIAEAYAQPSPETPHAAKAPDDLSSHNALIRNGEHIEVRRDLNEADVSPLKPGEHSTEVYRVAFDDGRRAVYKPSEGEVPLRDGIETGSYWKNEIAAHDVDDLLGFHLVPMTVEVEGPHGVGSLQDWVPEPGRAPRDYEPIDAQMLGVLDYILASEDRHDMNYMTQENGRPAAIDNGLSLPTDSRNAIKSDFLEAVLNKPLDERIVQQLNLVDVNGFHARLDARGISETSIAGALDRLGEAQSGWVSGREWPGEIFDSNWNLLKRSRR